MFKTVLSLYVIRPWQKKKAGRGYSIEGDLQTALKA